MKQLPIPEHILDGFAEEELKVFYNSITSQIAWIVHDTEAVSYTHLTLPTIYSV